MLQCTINIALHHFKGKFVRCGIWSLFGHRLTATARPKQERPWTIPMILRRVAGAAF
jgi:hypothetical protein